MHTSYIRHLARLISLRDDAVLAELLLDLEAGRSLRETLPAYAIRDYRNDLPHPGHRTVRKLGEIFIELEAGRPLREILGEYRQFDPLGGAIRIKAEVRDALEDVLQ
jgi:hypothetical protein